MYVYVVVQSQNKDKLRLKNHVNRVKGKKIK